LETIVATAEKSGEEGRIVNLASDAHKLVGKKGIPYDKLNDAKRSATRLPSFSILLLLIQYPSWPTFFMPMSLHDVFRHLS
jgi:hypothetical protein